MVGEPKFYYFLAVVVECLDRHLCAPQNPDPCPRLTHEGDRILDLRCELIPALGDGFHGATPKG